MTPALFKTIFILLFILKALTVILFNRLNFSWLKKHGGDVPDELADIIDKEKIEKIDAYNSDKMNYSLLNTVFSTLLTALFLFSSLFGWYVDQIESTGFHFLLKANLFVVILSFVSSLIDLPFSWYGHFVIEARHGFNRYTIKGWLWDTLKSFLVSSIVMALILTLFFALIGEAFTFSWSGVFIIWIVAVAVVLFFSYIAPVIILPIFYKLKPLEDEDLSKRVMGLVEKGGMKIKRLYSADESKKSSHANAAFTGIGKSKTIILFDTLLEKYSNDEILAVLAHEIGHGRKKHVHKMMAGSFIMMFVFIAFAAWLLSSSIVYDAFHIQPVLYAGIIVAEILFAMALSYLVTPFSHYMSRKHEYEADRFAADLTNNTENMISFLKKIAGDELSNINPHPLYEAWYYSHPSVVKRIRALRQG